MLAGRDGSRLAVSFRDEFRGPYVGYPDLNRSEALGAQTLAMFADPLSCASHTAMLHVTNANLQPSRWWTSNEDPVSASLSWVWLPPLATLGVYGWRCSLSGRRRLAGVSGDADDEGALRGCQFSKSPARIPEVVGGAGVREIAVGIGRSAATVSRELRRHGSAATPRRPVKYAPYAAQKQAELRGRRPKASKLDHLELADVVQSKLCVKWSPEQISLHLAETFADRQEMRVCPETDLPGAVRPRLHRQWHRATDWHLATE